MGSSVRALHLASCVCLCSIWHLCASVYSLCMCLSECVPFTLACALCVCVCVEQDVGVHVHWWAGGERVFQIPWGARLALPACYCTRCTNGEGRGKYKHIHMHVHWCQIIKVNLDLLTRMKAARKGGKNKSMITNSPSPSLCFNPFFPLLFPSLSVFVSSSHSLSLIRYSW